LKEFFFAIRNSWFLRSAHYTGCRVSDKAEEGISEPAGLAVVHDFTEKNPEAVNNCFMMAFHPGDVALEENHTGKSW